MNRIKELRLARGMKQTDLAKAVAVSQAALSGYETGKYEPDFDTLKKLATKLEVSVDYLLGGTRQDAKMPAIVTDDGPDPELWELLKRIPEERMPEVERYLRFQAEQKEKP